MSITHWVTILLLASLILLMLGSLLFPVRCTQDNLLSVLALRFSLAVCWLVGAGSALICQRLSYLALGGFVILGLSILLWRVRLQSRGKQSHPSSIDRREVVTAIVVLLATLLVMHLPQRFVRSDGSVLMPHPDVGFYSELVLTIPEAKAANSWAATLGEHAVAASGVGDQWYHWGMIFLAATVRRVSGLSPVEALMGLVNSLMDAALVLCAAAMMRSIGRVQSLVGCIVLGAMSLIAVQLVNIPSFTTFLQTLRPAVLSPVLYPSLATSVPYKFDAIPLFATAVAWLGRRKHVAALCLFIFAAGSPHAVECLGVAVSPLVIAGLLMRDRSLFMPAALAALLVLFGWGAATLCGASLPKTAEFSLLSTSMQDWWKIIRGSAWDSVMGLIVLALFLPGLITLLSQAVDRHSRFLGWLAVIAIPGSYAALHVLHRMPDAFHASAMPHALIIMPVAFGGLVRLFNTASGTWRTTALALILATGGMGIVEFIKPMRALLSPGWDMSDVAAIRGELQGRPVGYFTTKDRDWWIPKHAFLGALLESRCVRINPAEAMGTKAQFYGAVAPFNLVPRKSGEPVLEWCRRFMDAAGVKHLIECEADPLPPEVKAKCKLLIESGGFTLYERL